MGLLWRERGEILWVIRERKEVKYYGFIMDRKEVKYLVFVIEKTEVKYHGFIMKKGSKILWFII